MPSLPTAPQYHSFRFLSPTHSFALLGSCTWCWTRRPPTLRTAARGCMTASGFHPLPLIKWPRQVTSQIASEGWKGLKMGFYLLEILVSPNLIHLYHGYNSLGFFSPFTCSLSPSLLPHLSLSFSLPPFHPLNCNPMSSSLPRFSTLVSHSDPLICPFVQSFSKNPSLLE